MIPDQILILILLSLNLILFFVRFDFDSNSSSDSDPTLIQFWSNFWFRADSNLDSISCPALQRFKLSEEEMLVA